MHRVDLVAPELETRGLFHVGRVDIHNVAADGKLARAVHLVAPGIACAVEQCRQVGAGQGIAGAQRAGVGAELGPGRRVLGQPLVRHTDGLQTAADQITQHGQAAVLVLAGCTLNGAQHIVAGGEHRRRHAQGVQVARKAGGLGLAGGHDAERPVQCLGKRGVNQRPPCPGNAK